MEKDKDLLENRRDKIYDYRCNGSVMVIKWTDNKCVLLGSMLAATTVERYNKNIEVYALILG